MSLSEIKKNIQIIEEEMLSPDFWTDVETAKQKVKDLQNLKQLYIEKDFSSLDATVHIIAGAGGDDAEDFASMLFDMYKKYADHNHFNINIIDDHKNDFGGYKHILFEIIGKNAYDNLFFESGVHRLVRNSPFNSKGARHTSFVLVEVLPKINHLKDDVVNESELDISYAKAGGPGGQNVNKRETAVRIVHKPTGFSVHVTSERSQGQNKEKALSIIKAKIIKKREEDEVQKEKGLSINEGVQVEWGNQIRSYVLHPYKLVKDHRTDIETSDVDDVFAGNFKIFKNNN